jgi:hypothetical protein
LLAEEVPGRVVSSCALRNFTIRLRLDRMDEIGELNGVLNEEDGNVVPHDVEISFVSIASSDVRTFFCVDHLVLSRLTI